MSEIKKHPLAIAWDEWLASPEGQKCATPDYLAPIVNARPYLENRLHAAFMAGARSFSEADKKLLGDLLEFFETGFVNSKYVAPLKELIERIEL